MEAAFADQIIHTAQGRYSLLTGYFSERTSLLVGLSLTDPTLQHVLRQTARLHPGHVQYVVKFVRDPSRLSETQCRVEKDANFSVYNAVTLFLTAEEIAALAVLAGMPPKTFATFVSKSAKRLGRPFHSQFVYYLVGSSGVGKTTALHHFYSLRPHEEWLDPLPEIMTGNFNRYSHEELKKVDEWVDVSQWKRKNRSIATAGTGIDIVDRGPLDSLAYVPEEAQKVRARHAMSNIPSKGIPIVSGHIIRLKGDVERIHAQARRVFRTHDIEGVGGIRWQQDHIAAVYAPRGQTESPDEVCIDELTASEVARRIARIIHVLPYRPLDFTKQLKELARR